MGGYVVVGAIVFALLGVDGEWVLVWLLGLIALLGWRSEQPVLRTLFDWLPLFIILVAYNLIRANADSLIPRAHLQPMIWFDEWIGGGIVPTVRLQRWLWDPRSPHWYDYASLVVYTSHFYAAIAIGATVYFVAPARFARYAFTFLVCSLAGFATYIIYPAIPPWLASDKGAIQHVARIPDQLWDHIGIEFFAKVFSGDPKYSNPVGALPSEHAAYPLLFLLLFWGVASTRWRAVLIAYVFAMAFVLVYFAEHYVFDEVAGWVYAVVAFVVVGLVLDARGRRAAIREDEEVPNDPRRRAHGALRTRRPRRDDHVQPSPEAQRDQR